MGEPKGEKKDKTAQQCSSKERMQTAQTSQTMSNS